MTLIALPHFLDQFTKEQVAMARGIVLLYLCISCCFEILNLALLLYYQTRLICHIRHARHSPSRHPKTQNLMEHHTSLCKTLSNPQSDSQGRYCKPGRNLQCPNSPVESSPTACALLGTGMLEASGVRELEAWICLERRILKLQPQDLESVVRKYAAREPKSPLRADQYDGLELWCRSHSKVFGPLLFGAFSSRIENALGGTETTYLVVSVFLFIRLRLLFAPKRWGCSSTAKLSKARPRRFPKS